MSIEVIDTIPEDVYGIRDVQKETWIDTYPNPELGISREDIIERFKNTPEAQAKLEKRKATFYDSPQIHTLVAKDEDKIIGFCIANSEENRIQAIYVLPSCQGQGVGKKLMQEGLNWLDSKKDIYVNVASYNKKAIKFYENFFGFVESARPIHSEVCKLPSGAVIPEIELVKKA